MKPTELRIATFALLVVLGASQAFLAHNVLYTEGEIVQMLYWILVGVNLPLMAIALWKPKWSLWGGLLLGALLLPWQTSENRKWAQIHAEVVAVIQFVEGEATATGSYPETLDGHDFQRDWASQHITYRREGDIYRLSYFMDHHSISYWYDPAAGFDYYPD
ncbi:MAG: hypothetical protein HC812_04140 [Leptolyngbya sp. RL_3_1]|nr:hypothetical protein [Leptolyngbya sp. RL_3_1]